MIRLLFINVKKVSKSKYLQLLLNANDLILCLYMSQRFGKQQKILCPCSELRVDLHDVTVCMQHKSFNKWITLQKTDKGNNYQSECLLGMFEVHHASL